MRTYREAETGDKVLVFDVNGARRGQPEDGWEGEVVKAGPKLVYVKYAGPGLTMTETMHGKAFRRETGRSSDRYGHQFFRLPEEHAELTRRRDAFNALYAAGVEFNSRLAHTFSTEKLEALLAVVNGEQR